MSEQTPQTESQEEESPGGFSLEAKAGLTLVCLLAAAFSFMVWQKWQEMKGTQVAETPETKAVQEKGDALDPPTDPEKPEQKPELELVNPDLDPFGEAADPKTVALNPDKVEKVNDSLPPVLNIGNPAAETDLSNHPLASNEPSSKPRKANIPTLEVPDESPTITTANTADNLDPFGDEVAPSEKQPESATTDGMAAEKELNPFTPETETAAPETTTPSESTPVTTISGNDEDPFTTIPDKKPAEQKPDSFAETADPFAEPSSEPPTKPAPVEIETAAPSFDFEPTEPQPEKPAEPVKTVEADPFGDLDSKPDPFTAASDEKKVAAREPASPMKIQPGNSFQDPLPLLEPVPDQKLKSPTENPFGEFESVPAGAAQASSITQVSPGSTNTKRSGTLAELNAPASSNTTTIKNDDPFDNNPFAAPSKPVASEFKVNPDGTYEVLQGDSYWLISRKAYGSSRYYRALSEYNRKIIPDPLQMTAGKKIVIPPLRELEVKMSQFIPEATPPPAPSIVMASAEQESGFFTDEQGNPMYRVRENDTLTEISQQHLGRSSRWIQIYELNRDKLSNPNQLKIGTILKLPRDASRVRIVRGK